MRLSALFFALILFGSCTQDKPRCVATMEGSVFFKCEKTSLNFDSLFRFSSSNVVFSIPEEWQLVENKTEKLNWVLFDTSRIFNQGSALAVVLKKSDLSLKEYFYKEIDHADLDSSLAVIRAGRDQLGDQFCYWFQMERHQENMPPQHSIMYYIDGAENDKIVVDALVYGTEQMDERFCRLKEIANSVKVD